MTCHQSPFGEDPSDRWERWASFGRRVIWKARGLAYTCGEQLASDDDAAAFRLHATGGEGCCPQTPWPHVHYWGEWENAESWMRTGRMTHLPPAGEVTT